MADADVAAVLMSMPHDIGYAPGPIPSLPRPFPGCCCYTFACKLRFTARNARHSRRQVTLSPGWSAFLTRHQTLEALCCSPYAVVRWSHCASMMTAGQQICPAERRRHRQQAPQLRTWTQSHRRPRSLTERTSFLPQSAACPRGLPPLRTLPSTPRPSHQSTRYLNGSRCNSFPILPGLQYIYPQVCTQPRSVLCQHHHRHLVYLPEKLRPPKFPKVQCVMPQGGAHHGSSYGEAMSAELKRLQAKQLKRLHQAAEAAEVDLGPGWTAEVKVRQQGTTAGIAHIHNSTSDPCIARSPCQCDPAVGITEAPFGCTGAGAPDRTANLTSI